jgi:hypothetical protein
MRHPAFFAKVQSRNMTHLNLVPKTDPGKSCGTTVNFCLNHIHGTVVTQKIEDDSTEEEDALSVMSTAEQNCVDKQSELNAAGGL